MWSGTQALIRARQGEAEPLIQMIERLELQLLTPQGLETFSGPTGSSTIDFAFASENLVEDFIKCRALDTQHGSDHQAIETHFSVGTPYYYEQPRRLYKSAPWDKVWERVKSQVLGLTMQEGDVTGFTTELLAIVTNAVHDLVPVSKPSLYAKRWWNEDLSQLRKTYTYWRNRARGIKKHSTRRIPCELEAKAAVAKQNFFKAV